MFFPFLRKTKNTFNHSLCLNYFIIQRMLSLLIIFNILNYEIRRQLRSSTPKTGILLLLIIKIASIPFHAWLIPIIFSSKNTTWLLLSAQKSLPFITLIFIKPLTTRIFILCILSSVLISPLINLSQNHAQTLLFFSSISHSGWLLVSILLIQDGWFFYFLFYIVVLYLFLEASNTNIRQEIKNSNPKSILTLVLLLTLGGIPPLSRILSKNSNHHK